MAESILVVDDDILARAKAATVDQLASAAARWRQVWVPVAFAVGGLLLALAAPQWMRGVQAIVTYKLPTEDMVWGWLSDVVSDPVTTVSPLLSQVAQTWLNPGGQMDAMTTLAIVVLAVASVAGLAQLLGDEHKAACTCSRFL